MPRGGKKNDKKKISIPSVAALSLSETQPSTSQQQQKVIPMIIDEPTPVETQKRKEFKDEEEEEADGLGLTGGKRNRRKKKKSDNSAPSTLAPAPGPSGPPSVTGRQDLPDTSRPVQPVTFWGQRPVQSAVRPSPSEAQTHSPSASSSKPMIQLPPQPSTSWSQGTLGSKGVGIQGPSGATGEITTSRTECAFKIPHKILGRSVPCKHAKVLANYLEMTIKPLKLLRYDVTFTPDKPIKFMAKAFSDAVHSLFGEVHLAYDQRKNVYTIKPLPGVPDDGRLSCDVSIGDCANDDFKVNVSFKFTGIVDLNTLITYMKNGDSIVNQPAEAIQAIDIILQQGTLGSFVKVGHQFYRKPSTQLDLGGGLEMWTGLFQSAVFNSRPYINIDVVHKGFPKHEMLVDVYEKDFRLDVTRPIDEQCGRNVEAFKQFVKGLKVNAFVGGNMKKGTQREFIINELVDTPRKMHFKMKEGTPEESVCSVLEYFTKEKGCQVRYRNLNCVWVGSKSKQIHYPMEFLQIAYGQVYNKQLNESQLSTLVMESATAPLDRRRKIEEIIAKMKYSETEHFIRFGLNISTKFVNLEVKVLSPPKIDDGGAPIEPRRGVWRFARLLDPRPLNSWGVISVETSRDSSFKNFIDMIIRVGSEIGMQAQSPRVVSNGIKINELSRHLHDCKDRGIRIMFLIMSGRGRDIYNQLKLIAEREVGILTQCIKEHTATRKMNYPTVRNVMLKVNSKLMGTNHALEARSVPSCLQKGNIMLVGVDVTHPSPEKGSDPSIAAITASIDKKFTLYNTNLSVQAPKQEVIIDFENMMVEHLDEYKKQLKVLPDRIYVFRDGVSEGQYIQVMKTELQAIYNAFKRKIGHAVTKRPEILFIIVQKRHHTRLFKENDIYNVDPGTVVDTHIVHTKELEFYLVSHPACKGTARPTKYHTLCNDSHISQAEVEQLTYFLCHLYSRCTLSVSYPTPTYYAHLACTRARKLTLRDKFCIADLEKHPQKLECLDKILSISKMFYV